MISSRAAATRGPRGDKVDASPASTKKSGVQVFPQLLEELGKRQDGDLPHLSPPWLERNAEQPLQLLLLGQRPEGPKVCVADHLLGFGLDRRVVALGELEVHLQTQPE